MEFTGHFTSAAIDFTTKKIILSLQANEDVSAEFEILRECKKLSITIKKYHKKRSHDANAYMWVLLSKMAVALHTTKDELYLQMLNDYGVFTHLVVKPNVVGRVKQEWRTVRELGEVTVGNQTGIQLQCYFGSSTYDTKEMSVLIDGVVDECKKLKIETLTPDEIARMKAAWGRKNEKAI